MFVVHTANCHGQNCTRRAIYRLGIDTLIANILVVFSFFFIDFFVSVPCARLSWPFRHLLSARKYIASYRMSTCPQRLKSTGPEQVHSNICTIVTLGGAYDGGGASPVGLESRIIF